jgi:choice-of-anchor B domain-containing protein
MGAISRFFALVGFASVVAGASAQFTSDNVRLAKWFDLPAFGPGVDNGNHCWGYISPSGRSYAIMGLYNQVAFVEVTDPANSVIVGSIPHNPSLWADIKVYQQYCYVVSEASGVGIQVIDMGNIDNGEVSLVNVVTSPGRSHTVGLDPVSGYLYTHGSRDGTGTTMCFSLANPANPVRVGSNSLTGQTYVHDAQEVTYTSGPNAGKQVMFACCGGNGLRIYDVTNKSNVTLIKAVPYPDVGYCHQGWLDAERKYFYVNDEFDESNLGIETRSLVFDVESLANATYVTNFSTHLPSVDHNLYIDGRFVYEANYRTGLHIFDTTHDKTNPIEVGYYDTYPGSNSSGYDGAWSNYPYFPNGTAIISDIDRGLFVVDTREARGTVPPEVMNIVRGAIVSGNMQSLWRQGDTALVMRPGVTLTTAIPPVEIELESTARSLTASLFRGQVRSSGPTNVTQRIDLYNFVDGVWEQGATNNLTTAASTRQFEVLSNGQRFIRQSDNRVRMRLVYKANGAVLTYPWQAAIEQVRWTIVP